MNIKIINILKKTIHLFKKYIILINLKEKKETNKCERKKTQTTVIWFVWEVFLYGKTWKKSVNLEYFKSLVVIQMKIFIHIHQKKYFKSIANLDNSIDIYGF